MAALIAHDDSELTGIHFLKRGYENLVEKLQLVGAEVTCKKREKSKKELATASASA